MPNKRRRGEGLAKEGHEEADHEELALAAALFGDGAENEADTLGRTATEDIHAAVMAGADADAEDSDEDTSKPSEEVPAWVDSDDDEVVVDISAVNRLRKLRKNMDETQVTGRELNARLRAQHLRMHPLVSWAAPRQARTKRVRGSDSSSGSDSDEESADDELGAGALSRMVGSRVNVTVTRSKTLTNQKLDITRHPDANQKQQSNAVIQSVQFHPNAQLMLTAGFDKTLRLFNVDGLRNPLVQSVFCKDLPIRTAVFSPDQKTVIMSGRRKFFYVYDLETSTLSRGIGIAGRAERSLERFVISPDNEWLAFIGDSGYVLLVSNKTKQWVANLKMEGSVRALVFSADSSLLYTSGGAGEVFVWEMRTRRCLNRFYDEGQSPTCSMAVSSDRSGARYLAMGAESGIVNIYDVKSAPFVEASARFPKPASTLMNLTTRVDNMAFNADDQMLAFSSGKKKDSLRVAHVPSFKVFPNWPTAGTPLSYVSALCFSPQGGYLTIANDKGRSLLFGLTHYRAA